jgi:signal transduction histidine kinase
MAVRDRSSALHVYVLAVSVAGFGLLTFLAGADGTALVPNAPATFWLFAGCLVASDSFPMVLSARGTRRITMAETFAFAILLGWGTVAAALVLAVGSIVSDLLDRRSLEKVIFNGGQYALCMLAAGAVYDLLGERPFSTGDLPALAAAALLFYVLNQVLVGLVTSLALGSAFLLQLREAFGVEALLVAMLYGLAPILLIVAERSLGLLPLLGLPLLAVFLALKAAVEADKHRAAAEQAADAARIVAEEQARLVEVEHTLVERLQESDRLKDDLLSTVSHELRTPLAGMLGALATLSGREGALTLAQRQELVEMATRQGERLKELIEQLLLAARFEHAPADRVERPPVDAAELAAQAVAAARAAHRGRAIDLEAGPVLPVRAAPEAVLQVLGNLLDNAAKYSPDGAPIRLEAARAGTLAVLAVEDAGPGVPAAERDRIFERFTQLDSGATRRAGGVGLGLYIARQLAQAQGGELLVAEPSRASSGARFELRLPLAYDPPEDVLAYTASTG